MFKFLSAVFQTSSISTIKAALNAGDQAAFDKAVGEISKGISQDKQIDHVSQMLGQASATDLSGINSAIGALKFKNFDGSNEFIQQLATAANNVMQAKLSDEKAAEACAVLSKIAARGAASVASLPTVDESSITTIQSSFWVTNKTIEQQQEEVAAQHQEIVAAQKAREAEAAAAEAAAAEAAAAEAAQRQAEEEAERVRLQKEQEKKQKQDNFVEALLKARDDKSIIPAGVVGRGKQGLELEQIKEKIKEQRKPFIKEEDPLRAEFIEIFLELDRSLKDYLVDAPADKKTVVEELQQQAYKAYYFATSADPNKKVEHGDFANFITKFNQHVVKLSDHRVKNIFMTFIRAVIALFAGAKAVETRAKKQVVDPIQKMVDFHGRHKETFDSLAKLVDKQTELEQQIKAFEEKAPAPRLNH